MTLPLLQKTQISSVPCSHFNETAALCKTFSKRQEKKPALRLAVL
ncbi:hypothetical protein BAT_1768 [Bacillus pumilus ATCC 7061]|nr:hypothetical protein BAT_1768 [Bacillus pumilus ATCC 7061]